MPVYRITTMKREEKRVVGVVGVQNQQGTQVEGVVAGYSSEVGVQEVVAFLVKLGVVNAEHFVGVGASRFDLRKVEIVNHNREREFPEVVALQFKLFQSLPKIAH